MNATTQLETVDVKAEKVMYCPISSQTPEESGEGSTTNANSPDRTMKQHECGAGKRCSKCNELKLEFHKKAVWCKECVAAYDKDLYSKKRSEILANKVLYAKKNKDVISRKNKLWAVANKEYLKQYSKKYREENKTLISKKKKIDYLHNRDVILEQKRRYHKENSARIVASKRERRKNPEVLAAHNFLQAMRRAKQLSALPKWADRKSIKSFYDAARKLTHDTGIKYSVDHIIPLNGKTVNGLHIPANLQVIKLVDNCSKSNRLLEDIV